MNDHRRHRCILLLLAVLLLPGCVTTTTGKLSGQGGSDQEVAEAQTRLGISYLRQGDFQTARVKLEKAVALDPRSAVAHRALGLVYERLGDIPGAERHYRRAFKLDSRDPDVLNSLAVFLCLQKNDVRAALRYFDRALAVPLSKQYSDKAMLNTNAGTCAKRVDLAAAETYLRAALAMDNRYADALLQLADVTFQQGNGLQARAFLERYLATGSVSPAALWLGVQIETLMGQPGEAAYYAKRLKQEYTTSVETRQLLEMERNARQ